MSGHFTNISQHYNVVGAYYTPEHHAADYDKALPCLRDTDVKHSFFWALLAWLTGFVLIRH